VKKSWILGTLGAALLVVTLATPASAYTVADGGLRHYNFPKHDCAGAVPTHVDLYVHSWVGILGPRMDGRIQYYSGTCAKAASYLHVYSITLWQCPPGARCFSAASSGDHRFDVTSGNETWSSPDIVCLDPEWPSHVEVVYRLEWKDGSQTNIRDDNSYEWADPVCGL
jgi:hypothetical protein